MSRVTSVLQEMRNFRDAYASDMYPRFIRGASLDVIPIFYYHRISATRFREHLQHLYRNGYRTLTGDELYDRLYTSQSGALREIVLTFDDGLDDVYTVVYPLLREFGLTAIAYIVPGWIGRAGFLTWQQIREMHTSGAIDVQSHSMHHRSIFTASQVIDFYNPQVAFNTAWDLPAITTNGSSARLPAYGTPLYPSASRLSDARRYIPTPQLRDRCVEYVARNGGETFFQTSGWRQRLERLVTAYSDAGTYEHEQDQCQAIRQEVDASKQTIEAHLPGKEIRHFALPWHETGSLVEQALIDAGYRTMSVGLTQPYNHVRLRTSVRTARVNGDFVPTLPGEGRLSFWRVALRKATRRLDGGPLY